ncbi:head-to-tail adaptor [Mycobacterium phage Stasia]|uniref:Head-to-tail adaptor n=1 Tax=Mycobacterium phage Stasia TaxID=1897548 RepID=A0A1D8EUE3_9CAUD|nr:head-tail adaptor Ad1 [Mycobacterium phage Stasia]AOT24674.1 head-to-tail adaptor [Mycobacterium phage Stasia]
MAIATAQDVENRWVRELSEEETTLVNTRLNDAERMLKRRVKNLDSVDPEDVKQVEADMVLRLLRNPEGYTQETDGNYTYMLSQALASGKLEVLPEEWEALGIRRGNTFVLVPTFEMPT